MSNIVLPYTFVNGVGHKIDADQVNANFSEVAGVVNANDAALVSVVTGIVNAQSGSGVVTTLPSTPLDGQEVFFLADATNGVVWHLRYRGPSPSAYKWEFLGGGSLHSYLATIRQISTGQTSYADLPTDQNTLTVPLAGDYDVEIAAQAWNYGGQSYNFYLSYAVGGTAASDAWALRVGMTSTVVNVAQRHRQTGLTSGTILAEKAKGDGALGSAQYRHLWATPVRVG